MILGLACLPLAAGLLALVIRYHIARRILLVGTAIAHASLTAAVFLFPPAPQLSGWLKVDAPGRLFLAITSFLFLAASLYALDYLQRSRQNFDPADAAPGQKPPSEAVFTSCMLFFLGAMTWVILSQHLGLLWVAVEATTLASAPLIYFHRSDRSLEATWKYLLICSVGIALALLGTYFLAMPPGRPPAWT
jgi:hydrogenase-4 component F